MSFSSSRRRDRREQRAPQGISARELAALGMSTLAYIKVVRVDGEEAFAIHAADGTPMALADNRDIALAAILQHEMVPAQVH
ncbi:DUF1150 domain-containing protein [Acetobacteraceae bacterium KSS8]|uniref:DUF1150 domain-containing protein n=1 Tax=Endosaccharibacter trunci TaxID=2812733 RepID=A0ABT1WB46_9PROT|nr:DUF1150 domain-containing protein [Acetobacteraceae bacterium KSS8]